jgi:8-oxo-dGTP pyrophosphatase MutT (NUDIX family)
MMSQKIGCITIIPHLVTEEIAFLKRTFIAGYLGISCKKGRGFIMPGGKWEEGETYRETAARELFEETGVQVDPTSLKWIWTGPDGDGYQVMAFLSKKTFSEIEPHLKETNEGVPSMVIERSFLESKYKAYYDALFQVIHDNVNVLEIL